MPLPTKGLTKTIATFFGMGFIPLVPATWTSAAAVILAWFLPEPFLYYLTPLFCVAGFWACREARIIFKSEDPKEFVMDEVCGMFVSLFWVPRTAGCYIAAFFLFRLFDVWKPWPISKIQNSPKPWSVMGDDLLAGVFANLVLQGAILSSLLSFKP